jgi:predicted nucleic acid-binding protein
MKIIVDTNIVFSAMLNKQSVIGDMLLNSQEQFEFYTCEYLREELANHKSKIMGLTGYDDLTYHEIEFLLYNQLTFFSEALIPFEYWQTAANYVRDVDMDDIAFVALSLFLDFKLWTGDKRLREGLLQRGFKNCISTQELLQLRSE